MKYPKKIQGKKNKNKNHHQQKSIHLLWKTEIATINHSSHRLLQCILQFLPSRGKSPFHHPLNLVWFCDLPLPLIMSGGEKRMSETSEIAVYQFQAFLGSLPFEQATLAWRQKERPAGLVQVIRVQPACQSLRCLNVKDLGYNQQKRLSTLQWTTQA